MYHKLIFAVIVAAYFILITRSVAGEEVTDKKRAQQHFDAGLSLLETDNFVAAAEEFVSSVSLYPTKNGYFNLANCYFALKRYNDAQAAINRLKKDFKDELNEKWQAEIASFEVKLKNILIPVQFKSNLDDSIIELDGKKLDSASGPSGLYLDPGDHIVTLKAEGIASVSEGIHVSEGQPRTIYHIIIVNPDHEDAAEREPVEQHTTHPVQFIPDGEGNDKRKPRIGTIVAFSVGAGTGAAAIITGVIHLVNVGRLRDTCDANGLCTDLTLKDSVRKTKRLGVATNILIGFSAAGFIVGTILAFVEGKSKKKKYRVSVDPSIWENSGGITVGVRF